MLYTGHITKKQRRKVGLMISTNESLYIAVDIGGTTIKIIADGSDETDAVEGLAALVESGFAE